MASPQKEQGYTAIANEIMDALTKANLTRSEYKIILHLLRRTYGWQKIEDQISLSQFSQATGLSRVGTINAIKSLVKLGLLGVVKPTLLGVVKPTLLHRIVSYYFVKDYEKWYDKKDRLPSKAHFTRGSKVEVKKVVKPTLPTKEIYTKEKQLSHTASTAKVTPEIKLCSQNSFEFLTNPVFIKTFNDFIEMRKKMRRPPTERAKELILSELHRHSLETAIAMLEQSIRKSWQDVYPIKENIPQTTLVEEGRL